MDADSYKLTSSRVIRLCLMPNMARAGAAGINHIDGNAERCGDASTLDRRGEAGSRPVRRWPDVNGSNSKVSGNALLAGSWTVRHRSY